MEERVEFLDIFYFLDEENAEPTIKNVITEDADTVFKKLVQVMKANGNPHVQKYILNSEEFKPYLRSFRELGWIKKQGMSEEIESSLLEYHTVDEIVERISQYYQSLHTRIALGDNINWHEDTWRSHRTLIPVRLAPTIEEHLAKRYEIIEKIKPFDRDLAIKLGWNHYKNEIKNNEKNQEKGANRFSHKAYKKYFIPYLKEMAIKINDYIEMESFFSQTFLIGRWDWWSEKGSPMLPPRPYAITVTLSALQIASLVEANESNADEIIKLVLKQAGLASNGSLKREEIAEIPTFTWSDYDNSLTEEDIDILLEDAFRVERIGKQAS